MIKAVKNNAIKIVHKYIFGTDNLWLKKKNVCIFPGFTCEMDNADFIQKYDTVLADFSKL